jgi:glycosyltransferase involved in cell wall biosynthesis
MAAQPGPTLSTLQGSRIHIVMSGIHYGQAWAGVGQYTGALVDNLPCFNVDGCLVVNDRPAHLPFPWHEEVIPRRFESIARNLRFPSRGRNLDKLAFDQLHAPRLATRLRVDLLHFPYLTSPWFPTSVPIVVTVHDLIPVLLPEYAGGLRARAIMHLYMLRLHNARLVLVPSESTRRDVQRLTKVPSCRIRVIPYGRDERHPSVPREQALHLVHELGVAQPFLLYVGAYDVRKNLPRLLEAFKLVIDRGHDVTLVMAGPRPLLWNDQYPNVEALAGSLGISRRIAWMGMVSAETKAALYSSCEAVVYPSLYEGFGLPVLEGMAHGAPVISSNNSSIPEVAGDSAILVDPLNVKELADAMCAVLGSESLRRTLRAAGPRRAAAFSWERTARETAAAFGEVACPTGRRASP